jgi:hypothetical protein
MLRVKQPLVHLVTGSSTTVKKLLRSRPNVVPRSRWVLLSTSLSNRAALTYVGASSGSKPTFRIGNPAASGLDGSGGAAKGHGSGPPISQRSYLFLELTWPVRPITYLFSFHMYTYDLHLSQ